MNIRSSLRTGRYSLSEALRDELQFPTFLTVTDCVLSVTD